MRIYLRGTSIDRNSKDNYLIVSAMAYVCMMEFGYVKLNYWKLDIGFSKGHIISSVRLGYQDKIVIDRWQKDIWLLSDTEYLHICNSISYAK